MDPNDQLLGLPKPKRRGWMSAITAGIMVSVPLLVIFYAAYPSSEVEVQTSPATAFTVRPSYAEMERRIREHISRNGAFVTVRGAVGKNGTFSQIMPVPVRWTVSCQIGMLSVTVGEKDPDGLNEITLVPGRMNDDDCSASARAAADILKQILD